MPCEVLRVRRDRLERLVLRTEILGLDSERDRCVECPSDGLHECGVRRLLQPPEAMERLRSDVGSCRERRTPLEHRPKESAMAAGVQRADVLPLATTDDPKLRS